MTLEELREDFETPAVEPKPFDLAPGKTIMVGGVASFATMQRAQKEGEALQKLAVVNPITVGGRPVEMTKDVINAAVMVSVSVADPVLSVADAVRLSARYPLKFGELLVLVMEQSGAAIEQAAKSGEEDLALNPTTPPASA